MSIIENEPANEYHRVPMVAIGSHALMDSDPDAGGSLAMFHAKYIEGFTRPASDALTIGRATHARILERRDLTSKTDPEFVVHPAVYPTAKGEEKPWNRNAKYCEDWELANEGKTVLKPAWVENIERMYDAAHASPDVSEFLSKGKPEVVIRHEDPSTGLLVQCRFDWLRLDERLFGDLKTTCEESMARFPREALYLNYDRQIAWYSRRLAQELGEPWPSDRISHRIIASMKAVPWSAQLFKFKPERIAAADAKNQAALCRLAEAWSANEWPDDTGGVITID